MWGLIRRAVVCRPDVGVCFNLSIYLSIYHLPRRGRSHLVVKHAHGAIDGRLPRHHPCRRSSLRLRLLHSAGLSGPKVLRHRRLRRRRGLSLFGGASSEVRRCNCSVVDESRSSLAGLAARCVSFYQKSIYLSIGSLGRLRRWLGNGWAPNGWAEAGPLGGAQEPSSAPL